MANARRMIGRSRPEPSFTTPRLLTRALGRDLHCLADSRHPVMFSVAYLQDPGNGKFRVEEQMLRSEFERRRIPVENYTIKKIQRRALPLSRSTFIAGDMDAMHGAMNQLKIDIPVPDDYPESLAPFLRRRIWRDILGDVEHRFFGGGEPPTFVKPAARRKSFTGRVCGAAGDFMYLGGASRRQAVWCSEIVHWRSEYRVYVIDDAVVGVDHYEGSPDVMLDMATVEAALRAYRESTRAPSACGIDFGVLSNGETALVEANDGYALGAYTIGAKPYTDLVCRRWSELLATSKA